MSDINVPIGDNGDLDFSGIEVIEPLDADADDLVVDLELLELYEILEAGGIIRPFSDPRRAAIRSMRMIGSSPFISRAECGLRAPRSTTLLRTARGNTGHWEGPKMGWPWDHSKCPAKVRGIQAFHLSKGWSDIAYSSMECPHGFIFEGRWYGVRTAANGTNAGNDASYAHCALIGEGDGVTDQLLRAQRDVAMEFQRLGSGSSLWDHGQWKATACAGSVRNYWRSGLPEIGAPPTPVPNDPTPPSTDKDFVQMIRANPTLRRGSGERFYVRLLQTLLLEHCRDLVDNAMRRQGKSTLDFVDGAFGPNTEAILAAWQDRTGHLNKIERGVCGPDTWTWLCGAWGR